MNTPVLCSTARLARSLRIAHGRALRLHGAVRWQPLAAVPLSQWLNGVTSEALLCGQITVENTPAYVPSAQQERVLWERAIASCLSGEALESLFDRAGMAAVAMEANQLIQAWRIDLPAGEHAEETRQFLHWRSVFRKACAGRNWLESVRYVEWQIDALQSGAGRLPEKIALAGFDRMSPQETRLMDVLAARGATLDFWPTGLPEAAPALQVQLADADAECRAAVAWARQRLADKPQARIAIVAPELAKVRACLAAMLDDALHPQAVTAASADMPRSYDFSLGTALSARPLVTTALDLLRLCAGRRRVEQEKLGGLLLQPAWSAGQREAEGRAQLEAAMRADLPAVITLERAVRYLRKLAARGLAIARLAEDSSALLQMIEHLPARQLPSAWAASFRSLLAVAGWPGDRGLSSDEYQTQQAFLEAQDSLAQLDVLLGAVTFSYALRYLAQTCAEQIFQPRSEGDPPIQIMGLLETAGVPLDGLWVMGMNDHVWPPPARPNPLLPAAIQRAVRAPNADAAVQAEFAAIIHQRLLRGATDVVFSQAHAEGDRKLRPSPLLAGLTIMNEEVALATTLAEGLAAQSSGSLVFESDTCAPAAAEGERIPGGAGLLKAQAVCPAWAYYQYRLGGRKLETPVDGLDAAGRGNLLHAALQQFWQGRGSAELHAMAAPEQEMAVALAVDQAIAAFNATQEEALPAGFATLEAVRLRQLIASWLDFERSRAVDFSVQACEQEVRLEIEGIAVKLMIDRVDMLADGRLVIIDYKTGGVIDHKNWAEERITEPQLPIYASLALAGEQVAAVAFARVRSDEAKFVGIAADEGLLPGVSGLTQDKGRKAYPEAHFPDWAALLAHWQASVQAIAREVRSGVAAVRFNDEKDLEYCEVRPLLRLPERKLLFEREGNLLK